MIGLSYKEIKISQEQNIEKVHHVGELVRFAKFVQSMFCMCYIATYRVAAQTGYYQILFTYFVGLSNFQVVKINGDE